MLYCDYNLKCITLLFIIIIYTILLSLPIILCIYRIGAYFEVSYCYILSVIITSICVIVRIFFVDIKTPIAIYL